MGVLSISFLHWNWLNLTVGAASLKTVLTIFCRLWWMNHHWLSGMPVVPFSFDERTSHADKWVTLKPHQNLQPLSLWMTLQLVSHIILAWRTGKHSLLEQHYVHLFLYKFVHCYLNWLHYTKFCVRSILENAWSILIMCMCEHCIRTTSGCYREHCHSIPRGCLLSRWATYITKVMYV